MRVRGKFELKVQGNFEFFTFDNNWINVDPNFEIDQEDVREGNNRKR